MDTMQFPHLCHYHTDWTFHQYNCTYGALPQSELISCIQEVSLPFYASDWHSISQFLPLCFSQLPNHNHIICVSKNAEFKQTKSKLLQRDTCLGTLLERLVRQYARKAARMPPTTCPKIPRVSTLESTSSTTAAFM